jgi:hypothetical protein
MKGMQNVLQSHEPIQNDQDPPPSEPPSTVLHSPYCNCEISLTQAVW